MKKLNLYLVTPVIILTVMFSLGWLRLKTANILIWGDKTLIFLMSAAIMTYICILNRENIIKNESAFILSIISVTIFVSIGFWALVMYYLFTPRIGG